MSNYEANVKVKVTGMRELDKLEQSLTNVKNVPIKLDVKSSGIKELLSQLKEVQSVSKSIGKIKIGTSGLGGGSSTKIKLNADTSGLQKAKSDFQMLKNLANEISQKKIKVAGLDTSKNANQIKELNSQISKLKSDYSILQKTFSNSLSVDQTGKLNNILGKTDDKISEINAKAKDMASSMSAASKPFNTLDAVTASNKTLTWLNNNTKAAKDYGDALKIVAEKQKNATNGDELANANKEFRNITSLANLNGKTGNNLWSELKRAGSQIGQFVGIYGVFQEGVQAAKQMAGAVLEVDTAMTELHKVSNAPSVQITSYFDQATESAKKYGATISDVINSTADWSRLGYDLKDSAILSDITTLFQKVGDNMTQESASSSLISTLQGYELDADQAKSILDKYNSVARMLAKLIVI